MKKYCNKKEDDVKVYFSQIILGRLIFCSPLKDPEKIAKALIAVSRTNGKNAEISLQYLEESVSEFQETDGLTEQYEEGYIRFKELEEFSIVWIGICFEKRNFKVMLRL